MIALSFNVRRATLRDLGDINEIELECFTREAYPRRLLEHFLTSPNFVTLVAVSGEESVGFIACSVDQTGQELSGHIYTLDVRREYRGRGAASSLLDALEQILAERGVGTCYLEVRVSNDVARRLYSKHGYKQLETVRDYYGYGEDGLRFIKDLKTRGAP